MEPYLTVRETLEFNAQYRLSKKVSPKNKKRMVKEIMRLLGIEHIRNSIIGNEEQRGISGGQKKRVNIGMELVSNPKILFLDEPTSGLDTTTAYDVIRLLQLLAINGSTIICVLHQPRYRQKI